MTGTVLAMNKARMEVEVLLDDETTVHKPVNRVYHFGESITVYEEELEIPWYEQMATYPHRRGY